MSILVTELSEFDSAFYKRLKADEDRLADLDFRIKLQRLRIGSLNAIWLDCQEAEHALAEDAFLDKHRAEVELQKLERDRTFMLQRVKRHVTPST